jgi:hypothetical protein
MKNINALAALRSHSQDGFLPGVGGYRSLTNGRYYPRIAGGDRGYNDRSDLLRTLDGVTFPIVYADLQNALEAYNRVTNELLATVCYRTTNVGVREIIPGSMKFERGTEYGKPDRQRAHTYKSRGLPLFPYQLGIGYTRTFLQKSTLQEIDAQHVSALQADMSNILHEIMVAMFNDDSYTFTDDQAGDVTVKPLYNADSESIPDFEGVSFDASTHTHYLFTAGTTLVDADIIAMKTALKEHGHDSNRILYIAANMETAVRGLVDGSSNPTFYPNWAYDNPNVQLGPGSTVATANVGPEFIGMTHGFAVRVLNWLPAGYLFAYNSYGGNSPMNPFGFREYNIPSLQGLQLVQDDPNDAFPLVNAYYQRDFGVGVVNRSNGVAMYLDTGNGDAYVEPTISGAAD